MKSPARRRRQDCLKVIRVLREHGHETRFAGGCVRDRLLGVDPGDFDLATTAKPHQTNDVLTSAGYRVIPTGIDHGTVTVVTPSCAIEITTLRQDLDHDGRRATVGFVEDFREDASRRDFTINAMFEDAEGTIYDFFSGQEHLKTRELRFVGNCSDRIREDYLRILRYFRFAARLEFSMDEGTLSTIARLGDGLQQISQERITAEWSKTLDAERVGATLASMVSTGIYRRLFPQLEVPSGNDVAVLDRLSTVAQKDRFVARQGALLLAQATKFMSASTREFCAGLRLSLAQQRSIEFLVGGAELVAKGMATTADVMACLDDLDRHCGDNGFSRFVGAVWAEFPSRIPKEAWQQLASVNGKLDHLRKQPLPIDGRLLIQEFRLQSGPGVGDLLAILKRDFRNQLWRTRDEGIARAKALVEARGTKG